MCQFEKLKVVVFVFFNFCFSFQQAVSHKQGPGFIIYLRELSQCDERICLDDIRFRG